MLLAWRNLLYDRVRFLVTAVGIAFAVFLMTFQMSLLLGFFEASSRVIDASDGQIWIGARGTTCFDFGSPIESRFRELAGGVPGVSKVSRMIRGFSTWRKSDGSQQAIQVVGADPGVGSNFPIPKLARSVYREAVLVDKSNLRILGLASFPKQIEIGNLTASAVASIDHFSSFLGNPYVFTTYSDARRYTGMTEDQTVFLVVAVEPDYAVAEVRDRLRRRMPTVDVWTRDEFSRKSSSYWVMQTGAGGGILMAALLGLIVGTVIVSQTVYATTMENLEEFATLKAMGASSGHVRRLVLVQALTVGLIGWGIGIGITELIYGLTRRLIPWIHMPRWLPIVMVAASMSMCALASVASIRRALSVEPARVFRA